MDVGLIHNSLNAANRKSQDEVELEIKKIADRRSHDPVRRRNFDLLTFASEVSMYNRSWEPDRRTSAALQSAIKTQILSARAQGHDLTAHCTPLPEMAL